MHLFLEYESFAGLEARAEIFILILLFLLLKTLGSETLQYLEKPIAAALVGLGHVVNPALRRMGVRAKKIFVLGVKKKKKKKAHPLAVCADTETLKCNSRQVQIRHPDSESAARCLSSCLFYLNIARAGKSVTEVIERGLLEGMRAY